MQDLAQNSISRDGICVHKCSASTPPSQLFASPLAKGLTEKKQDTKLVGDNTQASTSQPPYQTRTRDAQTKIRSNEVIKLCGLQGLVKRVSHQAILPLPI